MRQILDANWWVDNYKPTNLSKNRPKKTHNIDMEESAEFWADHMRQHPSYLEKMMINFLDSHSVQYESQKIFYIKRKDGYITQFYIADFYIPTKKLIIEVDGKFHRHQREQDDKRTLDIKKHYKKIKVYRFTYKNFQNPKKLGELLSKLGIKPKRFC